MSESLMIDAVHNWIGTFNAIPSRLIQRGYGSDEVLAEDFIQLTGRQWECEQCGSIEEQQSRVVKIRTRLGLDATHNARLIAQLRCPQCHGVGYLSDFDGVTYGSNGLPAWDTLWMFDNSFDEDWAREHLDVMEKLGFVVYDAGDVGLIFGIDGAGYNFYDHHWVPLYQARGLQWHQQGA